MRAAALALLAVAAAILPAAATSATDKCAAPAELSIATGPLPNSAAAVAKRRAIRVLVIGTASSTTGGAATQAMSYPQQLEKELGKAFPGVAASVQTRGGRGLTAADMLPLIGEGLDEFRPDLLVWQSGTVDAVRGLDPDLYLDTISEGVEKALRRNADVVLMDMQFSRFSRATVNYGPFRQVLDAVSASHSGVVGFPRYELMRYWAASGQIDVEHAPRPQWQAQSDLLNGCIARKLAELIRDGIRQAGP